MFLHPVTLISLPLAVVVVVDCVTILHWAIFLHMLFLSCLLVALLFWFVCFIFVASFIIHFFLKNTRKSSWKYINIIINRGDLLLMLSWSSAECQNKLRLSNTLFIFDLQLFRREYVQIWLTEINVLQHYLVFPVWPNWSLLVCLHCWWGIGLLCV